jgi:hypothetical protein
MMKEVKAASTGSECLFNQGNERGKVHTFSNVFLPAIVKKLRLIRYEERYSVAESRVILAD